MNSQLDHICNVLIEVHRDGNLIHSESKRNLVVTTGLNIVRDLLLNIGTAPNCVAVGKGQSSTTSAMTALEDEQFRNYFTRRASASSKVTYQMVLATTDANVYPQTLSEAAIFSGATFNVSAVGVGGGVMFARTTFTPIAKDNTMTVTFTWDISLASS